MFKPVMLTTAIIAGLSMAAPSASAAPAKLMADTALSSPTSIPGVQLVHDRRGHHTHRRYGPRKIERMLRHRGFRNVRVVKMGPKRAVVRARGHRGPVRLVVDRRSGHVVARKVLRRHHYGHRNFRGHSNGLTFSFGFNL